MARTTPVHSGYTIVNGSGTGSMGSHIDVWVEYWVGTGNPATNKTPFKAYFYANRSANSSASTYSFQDGADSTFTVNGVTTGVDGAWFDFRTYDNDYSPLLLGSYDGEIEHDSNGEKTVAISGSFSTMSDYISGGKVTASVSLPKIDRGIVRIYNGSGWDKYVPYIHNGSSWVRYAPYVHNGTTWQLYTG